MKYKQTTQILATDLRKFCIENDFYGKGDIEEYENLFDISTHKYLTIDNLAEISIDIMNHTTKKVLEENAWDITTIMWALNKIAIVTFEEI